MYTFSLLWIKNNYLLYIFFRLAEFPVLLREAAPEKKRSNFGTFPKGGGGVKAQSKVKGALFATDRFPLGSISSYPTSMMVLHFSYLINSTLEPSLCVG